VDRSSDPVILANVLGERSRKATVWLGPVRTLNLEGVGTDLTARAVSSPEVGETKKIRESIRRRMLAI
jgi:hypothetical protein